MTLSPENLVGYVRAEFAKASNLRVWLFFVQLAVAVPGAASVVVDDKLILYVLAIAGAILGSGLIDQSQKMTAAAMHMAEKKV